MKLFVQGLVISFPKEILQMSFQCFLSKNHYNFLQLLDDREQLISPLHIILEVDKRTTEMFKAELAVLVNSMLD